MKIKPLIQTLLILSSLGILTTQPSFAATVSAEAPTSAVILNDLNFKTFFMKFYQKDIHYLKMKSLDEAQAVGLDDGHGNQRYAVYMPVQRYQNLQGEQRFIVWIQIFDQEDGEINRGHPSRPVVEMYLFKKLENGTYQLLSQSYPEMDISGSWGESHLEAQDFSKIKRVGKNQMGFSYGGGYTSTGEASEWEYLIVLNENGWIQQYPFGFASSNAGAHEEQDPEFGAYDISYKLIADPQVSNLYPIEVLYTKRGNVDWRKLPKNGTKEVLNFNIKKNCYVHSDQSCDRMVDDD
ncbi:hypothetical protein [Acinetobacter gerneri]|uniref:hypothetical protein n=1 Tax=Acinetobacter gerneri TaxID=202952 RepID=UPI003215FFEA